MLRIHSDRFWFLAFAALSNALNSSGVARTRSISALALPLGSVGRPTGLDFGCLGISELLHDGGSDGCYGGCDGGNMQHRYVSLGIVWVVCFMRPRIDSVRTRMTVQVEDFNDAIPDRLPVERLGYRHTFNVRSCRSVQLVDDLAEVVDIVHVNPLIRQAFAERLIRAWIRPFHCERRRCHSLDTDNIFLYVRAVQPLPHKATSTHLERWTYRIQRVTRLSYPHAETGRLIRGVCPTRKTATCSPYSVFSSLHRFFT